LKYILVGKFPITASSIFPTSPVTFDIGTAPYNSAVVIRISHCYQQKRRNAHDNLNNDLLKRHSLEMLNQPVNDQSPLSSGTTESRCNPALISSKSCSFKLSYCTPTSSSSSHLCIVFILHVAFSVDMLLLSLRVDDVVLVNFGGVLFICEDLSKPFPPTRRLRQSRTQPSLDTSHA